MSPQTVLPPSPTSPIDLIVTPVMTKRKKEATAPPAPKKGRRMPRNRIPGDVHVPFNPISSSSNATIVPNAVRFTGPLTNIFQVKQEHQHQEYYEFNEEQPIVPSVSNVSISNGTLDNTLSFPISATTTTARMPLTPFASTMTDGYRFAPAVTPDDRSWKYCDNAESADPCSRPSITTFNQSYTSQGNFSTGTGGQIS